MSENQKHLEQEIFGADEDELSDLDQDLGEFDDQIAEPPQTSNKEPPSDNSPQKDHEVEDKVEMSEDRMKRKDERRIKREAKERRRKARERREREQKSQEEANEPLDEHMQEFEKVVNSMKNKRKNMEYDEMDADEAIIRLCRDMKDAVIEDIEANNRKEPALAKLKLMPKVKAMLEKSYLHEQLLENEMLTALRLWLEPLPDGSLPSISIRKPIMKYLSVLPLTTDYVRESRIGRVIMFYYKCDKELPEIKKMAADLIGLWSRPILQQLRRNTRPTDGDVVAEDLSVPTDERPIEEDDEGKRNRVGDLGYTLKTARIPQAIRTTYSAVPPSQVEESYRDKSESRYKSIAQKISKKAKFK